MASPKFKLGPALPTPPTEFHPTAGYCDQYWQYSLDLRRRIVKRVPQIGNQVDYFILIFEPSPTVFKSKRQITPTIKHGVIVPSLVSLAIAGLFLVAYPLFPGLKYQVQKQISGFSNNVAVAAPDPHHNRLVIPKIGIDTTILEGPTLAVLNKHEGVWHQRGSISGDNFVIAGHRFKYLPPNTSTFYNLGKLEVGDTILVDWYGQRYIYTIDQTKLIHQRDNQVIAATDDTRITIYTCYDKSQTEREVVVGHLQP